MQGETESCCIQLKILSNVFCNPICGAGCIRDICCSYAVAQRIVCAIYILVSRGGSEDPVAEKCISQLDGLKQIWIFHGYIPRCLRTDFPLSLSNTAVMRSDFSDIRS